MCTSKNIGSHLKTSKVWQTGLGTPFTVHWWVRFCAGGDVETDPGAGYSHPGMYFAVGDVDTERYLELVDNPVVPKAMATVTMKTVPLIKFLPMNL